MPRKINGLHMLQIKNINSIQVFSVVARTKNLTKAAVELNSSQSAISYHIKKLEAELGLPLFRRTATGLELTDHGAALVPHVDAGLNGIRAGLDMAVRRAATVRVAVLPMFASRFLSAYLGTLWETRPDLQISIQNHNNNYADLPDPHAFADLGIQWGHGRWPRFHVTRLWPERLIVVCSPKYLARHPITSAADLKRCTLLHVDNEHMWSEWMTRNDQVLAAKHSGMMLDDRHFQLSATINGLGVSLFVGWLVQDELRSGQLVNVFGRSFSTGLAYHVISPKDIVLQPRAVEIREWILSLAPISKRPGQPSRGVIRKATARS
jgi:LysR family transcriptional regulator, glycine cleavage system transcriptional activator